MQILSKILFATALALSTLAPVTAVANDPSKQCMAKAIYKEARGESDLGKLAVAKTVITRTKSGDFANTVCGVIHEPGQFTWSKRRMSRVDQEAWEDSLELADQALAGKWGKLKDFSPLYFHSGKKPKGWQKRKLLAKIGKISFYI